jgi:ATP synthase I chain
VSSQEQTNDSLYGEIERRIERFLVVLGAAMTLGAAVGWGRRAALGAALGTVLCWVNFRWLRQGAGALIRLGLAQAGIEKEVRVPRTTRAKFMGRLLLLLLAAYATLVWLRLPVIAVLCGLTSVVPAILLELGYELMHEHHRWDAP